MYTFNQKKKKTPFIFFSVYVHLLRRVWRYQRGNQESVYRRRTDNTVAKRKSTKG